MSFLVSANFGTTRFDESQCIFYTRGWRVLYAQSIVTKELDATFKRTFSQAKTTLTSQCFNQNPIIRRAEQRMTSVPLRRSEADVVKLCCSHHKWQVENSAAVTMNGK